jgi:hypothetical protein
MEGSMLNENTDIFSLTISTFKVYIYFIKISSLSQQEYIFGGGRRGVLTLVSFCFCPQVGFRLII